MAQHLRGRVAQASSEVFDAYRKGIYGDFKATVRDLPLREHIDVPVHEQLIVELYSK